jgi:hypothetical protein
MSSLTKDYLRRPYEFLIGALLFTNLQKTEQVSRVELTTLREKAEDCVQEVDDRVVIDDASAWTREEAVEKHAMGSAINLLIETIRCQVSAPAVASEPVSPADTTSTLTWVVKVTDNYEFQGYEYFDSQFDSRQQALDQCRAIVDDFLEESYKPGMTAKELYDFFTFCGEHSFVVGISTLEFYSWDYAWEQAGRMCKARGSSV